MQGVPAVRRAVAILELLANARRGLSLSEISRKLQVPKTSAHRILNTLEEMQCVHRNPVGSRYYLGLKLVGFNRATVEGLELREEALPLLTGLMQRTGFTVHMAVLEHDQAVLIAKLEPANQRSIGTWVGRAMDVNSTAAGKALIAFLHPDEIEDRIKGKTFVRHNNRTIVSMARLRKELGQVRQQGYAVDNEEDEMGTRCVGAPVFGRSGQPIAAISVVGMKDEVPETRIPSLGEIVKQTATSISMRLTGRG